MEITNYTRYNTDDLKALIADIEAWPEFTRWRTSTPFVFSEFNPKNPYVSNRRRWGTAHETKQRRYTSKLIWARMSQMSILTPSKIYDNPLAALSLEGDRAVPREMLEAVFAAISERADFSSYKVHQHVRPSAGLTLRVMDKPAERKPKSTKQAEDTRKEYAGRHLRMAQWEAAHAANGLSRKAVKHVNTAGTHMKAKKSLLAPLYEAVNEAVSALRRVEAVSKKIQSGL